nr:retrotransposon protein [Tanacetum cinerariifolium]
MEVKVPYELLKDDQKKQLGKNNEAKMTLYNALARKEYERVFMCKPPRRFGIYSSSLTKKIHKSRIARLTFSLNNMRSSQSQQGTSKSLSKKVIYLDVAIDSATGLIDSEEAAEMVSGTKDVKAQGKSEVATIATKKAISLENEELIKFSKEFSKTYEKLLQEKQALEKEPSKLYSKVNELELEAKKLSKSKEVCLKCDLLPYNSIVDSGCTKNMTENRRLFTSYKTYDGGHVVFGNNLKGKVIGGGEITVLPGNLLGPPDNVLANQIFDTASDDSHPSNVEMYLSDYEDDDDNMIIPQTPSEEIRTRIDNTKCPPSLLNKSREDKI